VRHVGESAIVGYLSNGKTRGRQHPRGFLDANFGHEPGRGRPRAGAEEVAELGAAHTALCCKNVDTDPAAFAREDATAERTEQPLALAFRMLHLLGEALVRS